LQGLEQCATTWARAQEASEARLIVNLEKITHVTCTLMQQQESLTPPVQIPSEPKKAPVKGQDYLCSQRRLKVEVLLERKNLRE